MRKNIFLLLVAIFATTIAYADPVVLTPIITIPDNGNGDNPRSPILEPVLYLDGYTLTASDNTFGSTIHLLDEDDNVVFSTYIYVEGDIELPTTLTGTYTIEVIRGSQTFVGEITL